MNSTNYVPYVPIDENCVEARKSYVNVITEIEGSAYENFKQMEQIIAFVQRIVKLFEAILNFYRHMGDDVDSFIAVKSQVHKFLGKLIDNYRTGGHGFKIPHCANDILNKYMNEYLPEKTTQQEIQAGFPTYPQLHRKFFDELLFDAMIAHDRCKTLMVTSSYAGEETDKLEYMCSIHRKPKRELWEITITGKSIVVKKGRKELSNEDLKISMTSLLKLMRIEVTFDNFEAIVRVAELYILLAIYSVYKGDAELDFLETRLQEVREIYSEIERKIGVPVCIVKLASLAEKFLNKDSKKFRLKLQGDKIVEDCRKPLFFFLNKCEKYIGLILFFRCHKPTMLKSTGGDESVQFSLKMNCVCPEQTEEWQVTMSSKKLPLKFDFNPSGASLFAKCWIGDLSLIQSLRKFYLCRLQHRALYGVHFYNFLGFVELILISLIWQMSVATEQQEVDDHIQEFRDIIIFLNSLILSYSYTTMDCDAFKYVVNGANKFYSQNFESKIVAASKLDIKWTRMAKQLYEDLTVQGPSAMNTQTYMEEKGVFIHVDYYEGIEFTFKDCETFRQVRFTANKATSGIAHVVSPDEQKIVDLLEQKYKLMKTTQLITSVIFLSLYGTPAMKKLCKTIVKEFEKFGKEWKEAAEELSKELSDPLFLNYPTIYKFIERYNLNLKAKPVTDPDSFKKFLETLNVVYKDKVIAKWVDPESEDGNKDAFDPNEEEEKQTRFVSYEEVSLKPKGENGDVASANMTFSKRVDIELNNDDDSDVEEPIQPEWKKSQLISINNKFDYNVADDIETWTVGLTYVDNDVRKIIFKRNEQGEWVARYASAKAQLSEEQLGRVYEEIKSYSERSRRLDIDPLEELLFASTIIILSLKEVVGNDLQSVTNYLVESQEISHLIARIVQIDFAQTVDEINMFMQKDLGESSRMLFDSLPEYNARGSKNIRRKALQHVNEYLERCDI
ncbi:hypothetical protein Ciccas_011935 [Cichlidogyrus casuarinus]|uniref:Uncharacterized protein n=1 Tax=Cichlidogyrus casuarinus TaxID=1844966 RepID=A0ABD2PPT3_9PLAT